MTQRNEKQRGSNSWIFPLVDRRLAGIASCERERELRSFCAAMERPARPTMTVEDLCNQVDRLSPRAARLAQITLASAGPVPLDWRRAFAAALEGKARVAPPLSAGCIDAISWAIGRTPPHWPEGLRADPDFVAAHGWTLEVHLAAEAWKASVMRTMDSGASWRH